MSFPHAAAVLLALVLLPLAPLGAAEPFVTSGSGEPERDCLNYAEGPGGGGSGSLPTVSPTGSGYGATLQVAGKSVALSVVPEECPGLGEVTTLAFSQAGGAPVDDSLLP